MIQIYKCSIVIIEYFIEICYHTILIQFVTYIVTLYIKVTVLRYSGYTIQEYRRDREKLFLYSVYSGIFLYGIKFTLVSWIRGLKIYSYIVYVYSFIVYS